MIYADNAATTKLDDDAFEAMKEFLVDSYGNPSQPYSFSKKAKDALRESRRIIGECIKADADEIYFTSGGTESDNWAIKGFGKSNKTKHIVISQIEHHAIINSCSAVEKRGAFVKMLPVDSNGTVKIENLEKMLEHYKTGEKDDMLVSIMLANNEIGTIEPIKELTSVAHEHQAIFHTDAVQAVGHINIDVNDLGVDMLSASAHKFNGPKGIGFLYIKKGIDNLPHNDGGSQEFGKRAGTENVASIVGMAIALKKNCEDIEKNSTYLRSLEKTMIMRLHEHGLNFLRNGINQLPGNVSLSFADADGEMLLHRLDLKKICISTGAACDSVNTRISHVIEAIKTPEQFAKGTIRVSLGKLNTISDVITIADTIKDILG